MKLSQSPMPQPTLAIALYQPDIAENLGSCIRLSACMGTLLHVIEPCGFPYDARRIRRSAMDYIDQARILRHDSWEGFLAWQKHHARRTILITNQQPTHRLLDFSFQMDDTLVMGRETAGFPGTLLAMAEARVIIPMQPAVRSLNVAMAAGIALGEALRQTGQFYG